MEKTQLDRKKLLGFKILADRDDANAHLVAKIGSKLDIADADTPPKMNKPAKV